MFIDIFVGVQTDLTGVLMDCWETSRDILKNKLKQKTWNVDKIKDDDNATKFYTGLPSFAIFMWLFKLVFHSFYPG